MGLVITGGGLLLTALSLFGVFSDKKKTEFFERIFKTQGSIKKECKVFEEFLIEFPPHIRGSDVTEIMPRQLDWSNTGRDCFSSVYYRENGEPSLEAVATETEVKAWAYRTSVTATGLVIAFIGFGLQIAKYICEL